MAEFVARTILPYTTGLPQDVVVTQFAFEATGISDSAIATAFIDFWNGGANPISDYLSPLISRATDACTIELASLDVTTGEISPPLGSGPFTLGASVNTASLPLEVAACLSYKAATTGGASVRRRRGRVYIGPLNGATITTTSGVPNISSSFVGVLANAGSTLLGDLLVADAQWSVWSRADAGIFPITEGWVDNEFDTMRSRQVEATSRITWP